MILFLIFNINQNLIYIDYNKNIKFYTMNFINIVLKNSKYIKKTKKYHLILNITILGIKNYLLLSLFLNSYQKIDISQILLYKPFYIILTI